MRSFIFQAALLFASSNAMQMLAKRQQEDGAFVPDTTVVETCAASGPGYFDCGVDYCYNPSIGETCCTDGDGYFCPPDSFCIGSGYCCPNTSDEATCLSEHGLTALPTFGSTTATADSDISAAETDSASSSTTRRATITGGSSSAATESAASNGGNDRNVAGYGAALAAAVGGAAMIL